MRLVYNAIYYLERFFVILEGNLRFKNNFAIIFMYFIHVCPIQFTSFQKFPHFRRNRNFYRLKATRKRAEG